MTMGYLLLKINTLFAEVHYIIQKMKSLFTYYYIHTLPIHKILYSLFKIFKL